MKTIIRQKIQKMSDGDLRKSLNEFTEAEREDWRNWGDNIERMMAEELHRRGLLELLHQR